MKHGEIVQEFARIFLQSPDLASHALQEALTGKYEVTFNKVAPRRIDIQEDHLYLFPIHTGEKGVTVK